MPDQSENTQTTISIMTGGRYDGYAVKHDRDDDYLILEIPEKWNLPSYVLIYHKDRILSNRFRFGKYLERTKLRDKITKLPIPPKGQK